MAEKQNEDFCMTGRDPARYHIDQLIKTHQRKIKALETLSNMLPTQMTPEQNNVVMSMVILMGRS